MQFETGGQACNSHPARDKVFLNTEKLRIVAIKICVETKLQNCRPDPGFGLDRTKLPGTRVLLLRGLGIEKVVHHRDDR